MDSFLRGKSGDGDVEAMRERRQPKTVRVGGGKGAAVSVALCSLSGAKIGEAYPPLNQSQ